MTNPDVALFPATSRRVGLFPPTSRRLSAFGNVSITSSPYGVSIGPSGGTLPTQRIVEMTDIGVGWLRWQQQWDSIETSPGVYDWSRVDDAVRQCNAAGIKFSFCIQNPPTFAATSYGNITIPGTLAGVGQYVVAYINQDAAIWQLALGGTFTSGTQVVVESSMDGFSWAAIQTITNAGTYYGDATNLFFVRARCTALHSGDNVSALLVCNTSLYNNPGQTIASGVSSVTANMANNSTMFEQVFTGTFSAGTTLEIDYSPDGSTYTTFQTINGPGPITIFGALPSGYHYIKVKKISLHTGDSVNVATTGAGPYTGNAAKNYQNIDSSTALAVAFAHRYTLGDPLNFQNLHAEAIEDYNEGGDDGGSALLKTPYYIVQSLLSLYPAVKAINRNMLVFPGCHLKLVKSHIQTWQQAAYLYGFGPVSDGSECHYYPGINPPSFANPPGQDLDVTFDQYWQAINQIDVANGYGQNIDGSWKKPIHFSEFGWSRGLEDAFLVDSSSTYTNTFNTGGSVGTWTDDFVNGVLTGTGGSKAVYYNNTNLAGNFRDGYVEGDITWAEQAGIGARWVDGNNSYICLVNDASSATNPNTIKILVRAAGVETVLATASIAFTRGTLHTVHFALLYNNPDSTLTVLFDGVQVLQINDATGPQVAGFAFLYENGGKLQCDTFRMIQAGQVKYSEQAANLLYCYEHARASGGIVEALYWYTQSNANSFSTSQFKNNVFTTFPAYDVWKAEAHAYPTW
jgi:hypothetical protein